jgi:hypothetical protein
MNTNSINSRRIGLAALSILFVGLALALPVSAYYHSAPTTTITTNGIYTLGEDTSIAAVIVPQTTTTTCVEYFFRTSCPTTTVTDISSTTITATVGYPVSLPQATFAATINIPGATYVSGSTFTVSIAPSNSGWPLAPMTVTGAVNSVQVQTFSGQSVTTTYIPQISFTVTLPNGVTSILVSFTTSIAGTSGSYTFPISTIPISILPPGTAFTGTTFNGFYTEFYP